MKTGRLEAFSDGVLAIIITIMVLEIKVPHEPTFDALTPLLPIFLSYLLSFIYIGIYWNNHHHMLHSTEKINGPILWANLHLLFWISLIPFATGWVGENHFAAPALAVYGVILFMSSVAYWILEQLIIRKNGKHSLLAVAVGKDLKGKLSPILYLVAILATFVIPWVAQAIYIVVALIWLIPDTRIERIYDKEELLHQQHQREREREQEPV
ncbi:TMEM175 family protein [Rufibacter tibetensis]|uniref:DUF1211 domain-containing protein n=1 Tax=Rufibacter tibetensis TaxID=512763 RepID=A0A0P0CU12_9BACT|nr:TMEM175 family protein [Rufibacter tibetensis]ALI97780.1 hypothetical protein DC20_00730 [Rufibacter tibetensis]